MTWQAPLVKKLEAAMERNPGSRYVDVYLSRKQAEELLRRLVKPHLYGPHPHVNDPDRCVAHLDSPPCRGCAADRKASV